jgi:ribosomal protein S18 acetylase RimI-like enzyme
MKLASATEHVDEMLELEFHASEPYTSFVYDSPEQARDIARFLIDQNVGEVAHASVALAGDGAVAGMIAMLDGAQLRSARTDAAMALLRGRKIDPRGAVRDRLRLASETMVAVAPTELYLARIAVAPSFRRSGVARWLMEQLESTARARGSDRVVLEVSPVHEAAVAMYASCGYHELTTATASDPDSGRTLAYKHLAKQL